MSASASRPARSATEPFSNIPPEAANQPRRASARSHSLGTQWSETLSYRHIVTGSALAPPSLNDSSGRRDRDRPRRVSRTGAPVVVPPVPVDNLQRRRVDVIHTVDVDGHVLAAELGEVSTPEDVDAACRAERERRRSAAPRVTPEALLVCHPARAISR